MVVKMVVMVVKTWSGNQKREKETCHLIRMEGSRADCRDKID